MDITYNEPMRLPSSCLIIAEEEMVYLDGGGVVVTINTAEIAQYSQQFMLNLAVNGFTLAGSYIVSLVWNGLLEGKSDGLSIGQTVGHYWRGQTKLGRGLTVGLCAVGVAYIAYEAYTILNTLYADYLSFQAALSESTSASASADTTALAA